MPITTEDILSLPEDMQLQYAFWGEYPTHSGKSLQDFAQLIESEDPKYPHFCIYVPQNTFFIIKGGRFEWRPLVRSDV
jgi:hypothetical protein